MPALRRVVSQATAVAAVAASLSMLTRCTSFSVSDDGGVPVEAGADGDRLPDAADLDASPAEGATPDSGCTTVLGGPLTGSGSGWTLLGDATEAGNDAIQLTPNASYKKGGMVHTLPTALRSLRATIKMKIVKRPQPADGLAFFWASAPEAGLGDNGDALAFCGDGGAAGSAVGFITKPLDDDAGSSRVTLRDPTVNGCGNADAVTIPPLADGADTVFVVDVDFVKKSVGVSRNGSALFSTSPPRYFPIRSFGITAATGNLFTEHIIESATIEVCP